jgi:BlaI family transcriptional regulator, penicillinase repressor
MSFGLRAWLQDDAVRGARAPEITIAHLDNHAGTCSNHAYERIRNLVRSGSPAGGTIKAAPVAGGRGGVRRYGPRGEEGTEMGRPVTGRPSDMELAILKVLWDRGPSTVRQVLEVLETRRPVGYTTVLKMLQIMREKRLVRCDARKEPHIYRHRHQQRTILRRLAGDLLERAFNGSVRGLLLHALAHKKTSPQELDELRRLIDELEGRSR